MHPGTVFLGGVDQPFRTLMFSFSESCLLKKKPPQISVPKQTWYQQECGRRHFEMTDTSLAHLSKSLWAADRASCGVFFLFGSVQHWVSYNDRFGRLVYDCDYGSAGTLLWAHVSAQIMSTLLEYQYVSDGFAFQPCSEWWFFGLGSSENVHFNIFRPRLTGIFWAE